MGQGDGTRNTDAADLIKGVARRRALVGLLIAASALTGACSSSSTSASNPSDADGGRVELGAKVYDASCASCHGSDLGGTDHGPSQLSIVYEPNHHGDDAFRSAIANGAPQHHWTFGPMPPVPGLSAAEVDAVIAYVRAQQQEQGLNP